MKNLAWMNERARFGLVSAAMLAALAGPAQAQDAVLSADADTTIKELSPSSNFGRQAALNTNGLPRQRTLVRFDQAKLEAAVAGRPVVSASLELTVLDVSLLFANNVAAHRVAKAWTETGATWRCANDTNTSNSANNCTAANGWSMTAGGGYASSPTSTQVVSRGQGVVKFDVTADVSAFLNGSRANHGWLLKVAIEGPPGGVNFRARESASAPRLVLDLGGASGTGPVGAPCVEDADCGGYANAGCLSEAEFGIPGGYCAAPCASDSECPSYAACVQGQCTLPCGANASCSPGYFCFDTGSVSACLPTCETDADCSDGRQCAPEIDTCLEPG